MTDVTKETLAQFVYLQTEVRAYGLELHYSVSADMFAMYKNGQDAPEVEFASLDEMGAWVKGFVRRGEFL